MKQERMDSSKSEVSQGPPSNPAIRVKQERVESPAPSCLSMKSDWSMGQPINFKRECLTPEQRVKQERVESPAHSCLSRKSDRSMEQHNLKRECWTPELSEFSSSLLTEDHFRCSVCSEGLREPVSIPCGHSYCRQCISTYWAQPGLAGDFVCPQCSKSFPTRPELSTNTALVRVLQALQQAGFSPVVPAVAHAGPGDVACDICCGPKLVAVKTCVTCSASYCESHVRQHYTVPALQRHTLTQVTGDQRHTHQQDNVRKTESVKEEEKSETAEKKKAKMRISKLEQFKPGLKNISRHLEMGVAKALNRQRTTHSAGGVWEAALDPHFYGDLFSGNDFDFIPDIPETHVAPTDSLEKFIKLRTDQPIEANFLSKLVKKLDPATAWAREVRGGLQHRVERELERCRPEEGIIAHRTVTAGPHLASKVESLKDRAEGVIWNEICAKSLQK